MMIDEAELRVRIERLERDDDVLAAHLDARGRLAGRWRIGLLMMGLAALYAPLAGRMGPPRPSGRDDQVSARSLVLTDADGNDRASLRLEADLAKLAFFDVQQANQLILVARPNRELVLSVLDRKGQARVALGRFAEGEHGVVLNDEAGMPRAGLSLGADGSSHLTLHDKQGQVRASGGIRPDGAADFRTFDEKGQLLFQSPTLGLSGLADPSRPPH